MPGGGSPVSNLPDIIPILIEDGFGLLLGLPFPATVSTAIQVGLSLFVQRKAKASREILLEELSRGERLSSDFDRDEFCGLLFRYLTATKYGAARLNLRLMAQMIAGTLQPAFTLKADELAHYSTMLSQLTRDEVQLLATMWRTVARERRKSGGSGFPVRIVAKTFAAGSFSCSRPP